MLFWYLVTRISATILVLNATSILIAYALLVFRYEMCYGSPSTLHYNFLKRHF